MSLLRVSSLERPSLHLPLHSAPPAQLKWSLSRKAFVGAPCMNLFPNPPNYCSVTPFISSVFLFIHALSCGLAPRVRTSASWGQGSAPAIPRCSALCGCWPTQVLWLKEQMKTDASQTHALRCDPEVPHREVNRQLGSPPPKLWAFTSFCGKLCHCSLHPSFFLYAHK